MTQEIQYTKTEYPDGYFQLSFFDTKEDARFLYLNGSSWPSAKAAENEWKKIKTHERYLEIKCVSFSTRTKWAIERYKDGKRIVIKTL